jgi:hypothetical protein
MPEKSKYFPTMIGVYHNIGYVKSTIRLLENISLKDKKAMLEIPEFPIEFPSENKSWRRDADFYAYWKLLAEYLLKKESIIIPGNNDELERQYQENFISIRHLYDMSLKKYFKEYLKIREMVIDEYINSKNKYFLNIINDKHPDLIILGMRHTKDLRHIIKCKYLEISSDKKVNDIENRLNREVSWSDIDKIVSFYKKELPQSIEGLTF